MSERPNERTVYLNGEFMGSHAEFTQGIDTNHESLAIGASIAGRSAEHPLRAKNEFEGVIVDFTVYNRQLSQEDVNALIDPLIDVPLNVAPLSSDFASDSEEKEVDQFFAEYGAPTL